MKPQAAATILQVTNVDISARYYAQVLGFTEVFRYGDFAGVEYGNALIYLSGPAHDMKKLTGEGSLYIFCDEVDDYYKLVTANGAEITFTIDNRGYGMRDFGVQDPDGNAITFGTECKV